MADEEAEMTEAEKQAQQEKEEAEEAARKAAEDQPEDPSVVAKAPQPVLVLKEQFEAEWPGVASQFPEVEPEFGKEKDGIAELKNDQAPAMAYATGTTVTAEVASKPERTKHGWEDFVDNSLPAKEADEEGDIEAKPKRRRQQNVKAGS